MADARVKIANAVICEDVRREYTGKHIIIGAYGGPIQVQSFPAQLSLSAWLQMQATGEGAINFKMRWLSPQDVELGSLESELSIAKSSISAISVPPIPLQVQTEGLLKLQMRQFSDPWETICEIRVEPRVESKSSST